jgi:hypothetical protein
MNQSLATAMRPVRLRMPVAILIAGALALSGTIALAATMKPQLRGAETVVVAVTARPIENFAKTGTATIHGQLVWRGGLVLSSDNANFGGFSGLIVSKDGRNLFAVTDAGGWLKANIDYAGTRPTGLSDATIGALLNRGGKPLRQRERDAEEVVLSSGTMEKGEILIAFEQVNRITRYRIANSEPGRPLEVIGPPPGLPARARNGMEAVTILQGGTSRGRIVAFSENAGEKSRHAGWIWSGNKPQPLNVVSHGGFALTAAASLADGTLLLLERRFTILEGVRMRLRRIDAAAIKPGALLDGEVLIEADMSDEIDNMEALAVHTAPNGDTILTLMSDDNFNSMLQRTLLLQFTLPARAPSR